MLSFIVPVYNTEKYLKRCINSLLNSGANEYEIILVNDGSSDSSGSICEYFEQLYPEKIRLISKENKGVSAARNDGINIAKGTHILFVDSDDYILEKSLSGINLDEDVDFFVFEYTSRLKYDGLGNTAIKKEVIDASEMAEKILYKRNYDTNKYNFSSPWAKIYRKDIIDSNQLKFNESLAIGEDMLFNLQYVIGCSSYMMIAKPVYYFEVRDGSATHKFDVNKPEHDRIFNGSLKALLENIQNTNARPYLYYDNLILSISYGFTRALKYYKGSSAGLQHIRGIQANANDRCAVKKCSKNIKLKDKIIYSVLLHGGGKCLYNLLACTALTFIRK